MEATFCTLLGVKSLKNSLFWFYPRLQAWLSLAGCFLEEFLVLYWCIESDKHENLPQYYMVKFRRGITVGYRWLKIITGDFMSTQLHELYVNTRTTCCCCCCCCVCRDGGGREGVTLNIGAGAVWAGIRGEAKPLPGLCFEHNPICLKIALFDLHKSDSCCICPGKLSYLLYSK